MIWSNRICQALVLINLIYALISFVNSGLFLPILPLEEFFAALLFFIFGLNNWGKQKLLSFIYLVFALVLLFGAKDFLLFFFSSQMLDSFLGSLRIYTNTLELFFLVLMSIYIVFDLLRNRKGLTDPVIPIGFFLLIALAAILSFRLPYLIYFVYLALGLSTFLAIRLFLKSDKHKDEWSNKYNVFVYHAILILTNIMGFLGVHF